MQQIDAESDPDASFTVSIYTMEGMSTRALYYTGVFLAQVVPNAKFTPGSEEGQLVVWATAKDHAQIKTLIEQLQKAPPPELARTIKVYTLQHITAAAVIVFLQSAVRKAEVTADPADPQRINAWASPGDHKTIEEVLKQMDVKPDPESAPTARVYQLEGMSQTGAYYAMRFLREAVPRANFALGGEGGQVVVWARAQDHETIKGLIKQLVEESPDATRTAKVYSLQHATAATALQTLAGVVPQAALSAGADPSQLVAFARPRDHAKIAEVIKELDKEAPPETEPQAVVYTLQSGNSAEAMRVLRTAVPTASLSAGAEPHQLIAWARPADHKIIKEIVERLAEKGPAELARKVAVYTLEAGDATTAITFLQNAVPTAQFSVGSDPRRLIAWATPADHEAIKKAVEEMETGAGQMTSQVYRFRYADPQAAYTVLQALVPSAKMAIDAKEGSLVASGLPEDHVKIKATIDQMDREDAEGQRPALKVHRVTVGSVTNVYRSLALLFRNDATVQLSLDMDNDAVIAVASGGQAGADRRVDQVHRGRGPAGRRIHDGTVFPAQRRFRFRDGDPGTDAGQAGQQGRTVARPNEQPTDRHRSARSPRTDHQAAGTTPRRGAGAGDLRSEVRRSVLRRNGDPPPVRRRCTRARSRYGSGHPAVVHPRHGRTAAADPRAADQDGRDQLGAAPRPQQPEHAHRSLPGRRQSRPGRDPPHLAQAPRQRDPRRLARPAAAPAEARGRAESQARQQQDVPTQRPALRHRARLGGSTASALLPPHLHHLRPTHQQRRPRHPSREKTTACRANRPRRIQRRQTRRRARPAP